MVNDPIAKARFEKLFNEFKFSLLVETGTGGGWSSLWMSQFCSVWTVEIHRENRQTAIGRWKDAGLKQLSDTQFFMPPSRQIFSYLGDSAKLLRERNIFGDCPCFYLDAHGNDYWPLIDELRAIADKHLARCVIMIHDFKVPGKPWGYDSYKGQDLDLAYVKPLLDQINPRFKISFNEEVQGDPKHQRGILYATP